MRPAVFIVLLGVASLVGCGGDPEETPADEPPVHREVVLVSGTAAGGERVGPVLRRLATEQELDAFLSQFESRFATELEEAARTVPLEDGDVLAGGVAYVGCGTPDYAEVQAGPRGLELEHGPTHDEDIQCLAAETTVGLVGVPSSELR